MYSSSFDKKCNFFVTCIDAVIFQIDMADVISSNAFENFLLTAVFSFNTLKFLFTNICIL